MSLKFILTCKGSPNLIIKGRQKQFSRPCHFITRDDIGVRIRLLLNDAQYCPKHIVIVTCKKLPKLVVEVLDLLNYIRKVPGFRLRPWGRLFWKAEKGPEITSRLIRNYVTSAPKLRHVYSEITSRPLRNYVTAAPKLRHGLSEITSRLIRNYDTADPKLRHGWSEITSRLIRNYVTADPTLRHGWSEITSCLLPSTHLSLNCSPKSIHSTPYTLSYRQCCQTKLNKQTDT